MTIPNPNQSLSPPFIAEPPIYDKFFNYDGITISNPWVNWLNSITRVTGYTIILDNIVDPITNNRSEVALLQMTSLSTADRNNLQNALNGTVIYNLSTNRTNFREGGAWWTFAPVAA